MKKFFLLTALTGILALNGAEYFVSPAGSDKNPGTSESAPLQKISTAVLKMKAGDTDFIYAGFLDGEMYMKDGVKLHVRQMKSFLVPEGQKDDRITVRPTAEQMKKHNILHFKGK